MRTVDSDCTTLLRACESLSSGTADERSEHARWQSLACALRDHLTAEAAAVLPRFAALARRECAVLRDEHASIRRALDEIDGELHTGLPSRAHARRLRELLQAHAAHVHTGATDTQQRALAALCDDLDRAYRANEFAKLGDLAAQLATYARAPLRERLLPLAEACRRGDDEQVAEIWIAIAHEVALAFARS